MNTLADQRALKLGESPGNLKHEFAGGRCGVDGLLIEIQIDATGFQVLDRSKQINERAP